LRIRDWIAQSSDGASQLPGDQESLIGTRQDAAGRLFPLGARIESPTSTRS
jgi:hypothetical protein